MKFSSTNNISIDGIMVGYDQPCYVIAEIGINHNGKLSIAKQLIDVAVKLVVTVNVVEYGTPL